MFKKRYVAAAACALAMVGTANAVSVNPQGTGDFLIAPAYFIGGGLTTDLKVVNTSATQSVVAKVVFRHPVTSQEILDFLVYLSPSDVWTANVSCVEADAAGNCVRSRIVSADDSMQKMDQIVFGSAADPAVIETSNADAAMTGRLALPNQGYIEIQMDRAFNLPNTAGVAGPGVTKNSIFAAHQRAAAAVGVDETPNVLTGITTVNAGAASATLPMVALADYDNSTKVDHNQLSGFDVPNINTSVGDVEEVLWANNFAIPYAIAPGRSSLVTFTYPTKMTYRNWNFATGAFQPGKAPAAGQYAAFSVLPKVCLNSPQVFDNSENFRIVNVSPLPISACTDELGILSFGAGQGFNINTGDFREGWARLSFKDAQASAGGKTGVPAIVTYMTVENGKITWAYAPNN